MHDRDAVRRLDGVALATALQDSRARLWACVEDLDDAQWHVPMQDGVNPIAWEIAHVAWFAEFWILRGPHRVDADGRVQATAPARLAGPDALFDSSRLAHDDRWRVDLPGRGELRARLDAQLQACLQALPAGPAERHQGVQPGDDVDEVVPEVGKRAPLTPGGPLGLQPDQHHEQRDQRHGQPFRVIGVVKAIAPLDAEPPVVRRPLTSGDAGDGVVFHLIRDATPDTAVWADGIHRRGGLEIGDG